jgi:hypothetical protein
LVEPTFNVAAAETPLANELEGWEIAAADQAVY